MLESSEVKGGGSTIVVGSTNAFVVGSLEEGEGGSTPKDDTTIGHLELALI